MSARRRLPAWALDGAIAIVWLLSFGAVAAHEHGLWSVLRSAPRRLIAPLEVKEQWFSIYHHGRKIGFTHLLLMPDEQDKAPGMRLVDEGRMRFTLMGAPQTLQLRADAFIDTESRLRSFDARVQAEGYALRLSGRREGDAIRFELVSGDSKLEQRIPDPGNQLWVSGLSSWTAFRRLSVGQRGRMMLLNPLALRPEPVDFTVVREELLDGRLALVVESDFQGLRATTWIGPDGMVWKESSPLGWELRQEPREQAMALPDEPEQTVDLLSSTAVAVDRALPEPSTIRRLRLLIEGASCEAVRVERYPWQQLVPPEAVAASVPGLPTGAWCVVELTRDLSGRPLESPRRPPARYVEPSLFVESRDPAIMRQAANITGDAVEPAERAERLARWVHHAMSRQLTVGFPSAKTILRTRVGDCHEHTVLFTALARSAGLPTRMVAGLVSFDGRFFYHAWPEVWLERLWVPMDPTLGESVANATHLGFVEAEGQELVALSSFVGQIRLRVLEMDTDP